MKGPELAGLLRRAADDLPEPDLAAPTWAAGRTARRRRWGTRAVGALAACGVVGVLGLQVVGGGGDGAPGGTVAPGAPPGTGAVVAQVLDPPAPYLEQVSRDEAAAQDRSAADLAPMPDQAAASAGPTVTEDAGVLSRSTGMVAGSLGRGSDRAAHQVWVSLYTGCLTSRGYDVTTAGAALSVTRAGAVPGDYERDLAACRAELVTDPPVTAAPGHELTLEERSRLAGRYFQYYWARRCLLDAGLPTGDLMLAEHFISTLPVAQLPPWHPYQEAAEQGRYTEARAACPIAP